MDVSRRRVGVRSSVVAGSVWESRMKSDEVRGGVKVFNGEENGEEGGNVGGITRLKRSQTGVAIPTGKRKTWKSESPEGLEKSPIQIARGKTVALKNCGEQQCKEMRNSVSSDGIKKSPIQGRKVVKTEGNKEVGGSADKVERSPIHTTKKLRSEEQNGTSELGESCDGIERNIGKLRKGKSDPIKTENQSVKGVAGCADRNGESSIQLRKTKSELDHDLDEPRNGIDGSDGGCGSVLIENGKNGSDENCKDFGDCKDFCVCQEKVISSSSDNLGVVRCSPELSVQVDGDSDDVIDDEGEEDEEEEEMVDEEVDIEMEKRSFDVKEISISESKVVNEPEKKVVANEPEKKVVVKELERQKIVDEPEKKVVVKEPEKQKIVNEPEPKKVVSRRFHQRNERPVSVPLTVKQSPPIRRHSSSTIHQNFSKADPIPKTEEYSSFPQNQNKLQSLVDLIMWRDISRSAFIFGIGTFIIVSLSYAKDINLSLISATSYMGLVYLAVIFLYRSLICREVIEVDNENYVLGEEEAIRVLKLILPYLNEFLSRLRAMFSGDPGTTIKLAVLLFVLARCGSSITIWKMAKFGFFGVFTVPKICSSYSAQLTAHANFWIRRFRDAWDSCSHKKAVALGIFGLVWNLSSVVARIWAVFVLFVAFRYYQQHYLVRDEWVEDEAGCDETWQEHVGVQRHGRAPNFVETHKVKKGF